MTPENDILLLHEWLKAHQSELLADTLAVLKIPTMESEAFPNAPYGKENREVLDLALGLAQKYGFKTTDLEGHLGYAEFGEGDALIMSLGHLDVVPVGPGWKFGPFSATIDNGYIYARGATDDKGPTMASFYAMRALKEVCPNLGVRFRQAFGCDEESGFGCVHRYAETEETPTFGVAPDSGWPLYHAEKGIANLTIKVEPKKTTFQLIKLEGGQRHNIVVDSAVASYRVSEASRPEVEEKLAKAWDANVTTTWDGDVLNVMAKGKAAHGSTPFLGDSAVTRALRLGYEVAPPDAKAALEELLLITHPGGLGLGITHWDQPSEDLTLNLGIAQTEGEAIKFLINVRYPVTWTGDELVARCRAFLAKAISKSTLEDFTDSKPLYFPLDHPMVKIIVDAYAEETGEHLTPGTMGGGTYARALPNTVSIGTGWAGDGEAHETDERVAIESLYKMSRIYAHILYKLALKAKENA